MTESKKRKLLLKTIKSMDEIIKLHEKMVKLLKMRRKYYVQKYYEAGGIKNVEPNIRRSKRKSR